MEIYFDNAATTALDPAVLEAMMPYLTRQWGNASATHRRGREARRAIETARHTIADLLRAEPNEIFFTSGATESNNMALVGSIRTGTIRDVISSPIEHKAVLQPLNWLNRQEIIQLNWVSLDAQGQIDYDHLEHFLDSRRNSGLSGRRSGGILVSLMHGNNEIGNLTDIDRVAWLCREYGCLFHSDTTQTMGRYPYNLQELPVDFLVGSAHKFHGPQGIGFLFARHSHRLPPLVQGGSQERGHRPGTEYVAGIVGLAKALEISYQNRLEHQRHMLRLKKRLINQLLQRQPSVQFNGTSGFADESLTAVVNVSLPPIASGRSLVNELDQAGIAVSGGSACSNLNQAGSHVLQAIGFYPGYEHIRISFGKDNTEAEVDRFIKILNKLYASVPTDAKQAHSEIIGQLLGN